MRSELARFLRFGVVGASNTLLTLCAFAALTRLGVVADAASALGFLAGAVNGYLPPLRLPSVDRVSASRHSDVRSACGQGTPSGAAFSPCPSSPASRARAASSAS